MLCYAMYAMGQSPILCRILHHPMVPGGILCIILRNILVQFHKKSCILHHPMVARGISVSYSTSYFKTVSQKCRVLRHPMVARGPSVLESRIFRNSLIRRPNVFII